MDFSPEEFDEILNIFREETDEIIDKLNNNLLRLENTPKDKEILVYMFLLVVSQNPFIISPLYLNLPS